MQNKQFTKSTLWTDIHGYFINRFTSDPELEEMNYTADFLESEMKEHLPKQNPEVILQLLKRGFEVTPGQYIFHRRDFILEIKDRLEGVVL